MEKDIERINREPRQIIVVNSSLEMPPGKLAAQVAHASLGCILKEKSKKDNGIEINFEKDSPFDLWLNGRFTKIVVKVKSEEQLLNVYNKAIEKGLTACLIQDAGFTCFNGVPTYTCVGIGPDFKENLDPVTKRLQVL